MASFIFKNVMRETRQRKYMFHPIAVDWNLAPAYTAPGPRLPNEVLSFWKE